MYLKYFFFSTQDIVKGFNKMYQNLEKNPFKTRATQQAYLAGSATFFQWGDAIENTTHTHLQQSESLFSKTRQRRYNKQCPHPPKVLFLLAFLTP